MGHIYKMKYPEVFQGSLKSKQYFEGWYFKIIDASVQNIYAFIIGVSLEKQTSLSHAFIQYFNATEHCAYYFKYPVNEFFGSKVKCEIKIDKSIFSSDKIALNIDQEGQCLQGELTFSDLVPIPKQGIGHGIMGIASYLPKLQCRHGIVSLNHNLKGTLVVNGEEKEFTGGKGYLEKDWGTSFPAAYIWMQTNNFEKDDLSLVGSIATVPILGIKVRAWFIVFLYNGKVIRFTNYNGAKIRMQLLEEMHTIFTVSKGKFELEIDGVKTPGIDLPSPSGGGMKSKISESLTSTIYIRYYEEKGHQKLLLYEGAGYPAGLEIQATREALKLA